MNRPRQAGLASLALAALGVVYGDIGTSPLYTVRQVLHVSGSARPGEAEVLGIVSAIVWSLVLVVTLKYVTLVMRADNDGEGGIVALLALASRAVSRRPRLNAALVMLGLCGAALFYGDAVITPAISVMSALEGVEVARPAFAPYVVPLSLAVLAALFAAQSRGATRIGHVFGPVMLVWFGVIAAAGAWKIAATPAVLKALDPVYAFEYLRHHGGGAFVALGAIVLAVTGAEALYADMGHLGRRPIRLTWFLVVFPALASNYLGQGALLLANPDAVRNPFYLLFPQPLLYPVIALAGAATVIASQAVISGAFSMTRQAIHVGFLPRMRIRHTSSREPGQIYIAAINWMLFVAVIVGVLAFRSSTSLGAAYGIAVTGTMLITTVLAFFVVHNVWGRGWLLSLLVTAPFFVLDLAFFGSNTAKIAHGGWYPLAIAAAVFYVMTTWRRGRHLVARAIRGNQASMKDCVASMGARDIRKVDRTGVFLLSDPDGAPHAFLNNIEHNRVIHTMTVFVCVEYPNVPFIRKATRCHAERLGEGLHRVTVRFGYMEQPDLVAALEKCREEGLDIDLANASFFVSAEIIGASGEERRMSRSRTAVFAAMSRLSSDPEYLAVPVERIVALAKPVRI